MPLHLVIASKRYSSWSLRAWLPLAHFGIPFSETLVPLGQDDTRARILVHSPSGRVPCLIDGATHVWESLAILEYLAELFPEHAFWPRGRAARAEARAIAAEMHAGFAALRSALPMNLGRAPAPAGLPETVAGDVARIEALWAAARSRFGCDGPFLFGGFGAADAMYAPVVTRLQRYGVPVSAVSQSYMDAVLALPAMQAWQAAADAEPAVARYEGTF
ncbi:glutathione S-transferase family protein [Pseudoxanthobacter sp.]|uniref:glutathione S-transferase family protein n=1 Tax=Pseudoxanthobacter sp. TaxID=1925742 RepID=UPI002FDFC6A8